MPLQLFEAGLIAYGADPELWNKMRVLLPDKSIGMLKVSLHSLHLMVFNGKIGT